MKPHWTVKTATRPLGIKCKTFEDACTLANTMPEQNPVIEYVRKIGAFTVITPVEIETK